MPRRAPATRPFKAPKASQAAASRAGIGEWMKAPRPDSVPSARPRRPPTDRAEENDLGATKPVYRSEQGRQNEGGRDYQGCADLRQGTPQVGIRGVQGRQHQPMGQCVDHRPREGDREAGENGACGTQVRHGTRRRTEKSSTVAGLGLACCHGTVGRTAGVHARRGLSHAVGGQGKVAGRHRGQFPSRRSRTGLRA